VDDETEKYLMDRWYWFVIAFVLIILSIWVAMPNSMFQRETVSVHGSDNGNNLVQPVPTTTASNVTNTLALTAQVSTDIFSNIIKTCVTLVVLGAVLIITGSILYTLFETIRGSFGGWR
jgi:DMSO reductase anchor subunit